MGKIGLFGGTFDPPHLGHTNILKGAIKTISFDKIFIIPTKIPPHKNDSGITDEKMRLEMVNLAFSAFNNVVISDMELKRQGKSYSFDTIVKLKNDYPNDEIYFIMGTDMFLYFDKWYKFSKIFDLCTLLVAPREKDDFIKNKEKKLFFEKNFENAKILFIDYPVLDISSTTVRQQIEKQGNSKFLSKEVIDFIKNNNLYNLN